MNIKSMNLCFTKLIEPASEIAEAFNRWENDAVNMPFRRIYLRLSNICC